MASCPKCGKAKIRKQKNGRKKCRLCGFLPTVGLAPKNSWGSCFDAAAHNFLANIGSDIENMTMCHAIGIANKPGEEGRKIAHAWIEFDHPQGRCAFDPIWLVAQESSLYRKNLSVELVIEYPEKEFIRLWKEYDFPGPWDKRIAAFTTEGKLAA